MKWFSVLLSLQIFQETYHFVSVAGVYLGYSPPGCDKAAALECEQQFLLCKLFKGPVNDPATLCSCATDFYGSCLRLAGCETAKEVGALTTHEIYMKTCVDFIIEYNCPNSLICGINCASDTQIDENTMKLIPFNNYGQYYLRIRTCPYKVHQQQYSRYSMVEQLYCGSLSEFEVCSRWIPPLTFVPVAIPLNTTYMEIDSCQETMIAGNITYSCLPNTVDRVYGTKFLFPRSYNVAQSNFSTCSKNADCLGSFCDTSFQPSICSPKTIQQALGPGSLYLSIQ